MSAVVVKFRNIGEPGKKTPPHLRPPKAKTLDEFEFATIVDSLLRVEEAMDMVVTSKDIGRPGQTAPPILKPLRTSASTTLRRYASFGGSVVPLDAIASGIPTTKCRDIGEPGEPRPITFRPKVIVASAGRASNILLAPEPIDEFAHPIVQMWRHNSIFRDHGNHTIGFGLSEMSSRVIGEPSGKKPPVLKPKDIGEPTHLGPPPFKPPVH